MGQLTELLHTRAIVKRVMPCLRRPTRSFAGSPAPVCFAR